MTNRWNVEEAAFSSAGTPASKLRFFLRYGVPAPSRYNTPPWRVKVRGDIGELYAGAGGALPVLGPLHRELVISCGAALLFLRLALAHFGYTAHVMTFPDPAQPEPPAQRHLGRRSALVTATEELLVHTILSPMISADQPQSSLVWVDYDGKHLLINTGLGRQKCRNMQANPRVTRLVVDPRKTDRWIDGRGWVAALTSAGATPH
jgi:hypothetical protein